MSEQEQIKMAQMQKDIDYIKRDMVELKDLVVELPQKIDSAIGMLTKEFDRREERYNQKFAPMYAWRFMIWAGAIVGSYLIYWVIKALER
jgi:hypothetical protein